MEFKGEYFGILKLGFCNEKGLRIIYHYLNDELYYIDYSATAFKKNGLRIVIKQDLFTFQLMH